MIDGEFRDGSEIPSSDDVKFFSPIMEHFMEKTVYYRKTSSIENVVDRSVVFVRNRKQLMRLASLTGGSGKDIVILVPKSMPASDLEDSALDVKQFYCVDDVDSVFVQYHNWVNKRREPAPNAIWGVVHPTASIGGDAMKFIYEPGNPMPIQMKHMGRVVIQQHARVFAYANIHRATLDSTIVEWGAQIGPYSNIGHNAFVGMNTILTPQCCLGGSSRIGKHCYLGMRTVVRDGVSICDQVKVGMGSMVVKDIEQPGLYYGSPATRKGDWNGKWHQE